MIPQRIVFMDLHSPEFTKTRNRRGPGLLVNPVGGSRLAMRLQAVAVRWSFLCISGKHASLAPLIQGDRRDNDGANDDYRIIVVLGFYLKPWHWLLRGTLGCQREGSGHLPESRCTLYRAARSIGTVVVAGEHPGHVFGHLLPPRGFKGCLDLWPAPAVGVQTCQSGFQRSSIQAFSAWT